MTKSELTKKLSEDQLRYNCRIPKFKDWLIKNEGWYIFKLISHLRYLEYYKSKGRLYKLAYLYHFYIYKKLSFKLHITIYPNTTGGGLRIYHCGDFTHVSANCRIGKNCTILPGVVFGNKYEKESDGLTIVGDNCYFGLGAKIFGPLTIGNNVTVGANAVVTKDIPDNAVVGGVPAKIIKMKTDEIFQSISGGGKNLVDNTLHN